MLALLRYLVLTPIGCAAGAIGLALLNQAFDQLLFPKEVADGAYAWVIGGRLIFGAFLGTSTGIALASRWNGDRKSATYACIGGSALVLIEVSRETISAGPPFLYTLMFYGNLTVLWSMLLLIVGVRLLRSCNRPWSPLPDSSDR